jgi:hypothetical protein
MGVALNNGRLFSLTCCASTHSRTRTRTHACMHNACAPSFALTRTCLQAHGSHVSSLRASDRCRVPCSACSELHRFALVGLLELLGFLQRRLENPHAQHDLGPHWLWHLHHPIRPNKRLCTHHMPHRVVLVCCEPVLHRKLQRTLRCREPERRHRRDQVPLREPRRRPACHLLGIWPQYLHPRTLVSEFNLLLSVGVAVNLWVALQRTAHVLLR